MKVGLIVVTILLFGAGCAPKAALPNQSPFAPPRSGPPTTVIPKNLPPLPKTINPPTAPANYETP